MTAVIMDSVPGCTFPLYLELHTVEKSRWYLIHFLKPELLAFLLVVISEFQLLVVCTFWMANERKALCKNHVFRISRHLANVSSSVLTAPVA